MPTSRLFVKIDRSSRDSESEFSVERIRPMTVLDALLAVQRQYDATVGFRFSCRVAMCGTCTIRVNGRSVLACQRVIADTEDEITLSPAAGFPVIKDLITDPEPFWEQWRRIQPYVSYATEYEGPAIIPPDSSERQAIDPALDCIQCGACFSSCGVSGGENSFIGPAALTRALVLINDSRDDATEERLDTVGGPDGVDRCKLMYGCTGVCPKNLDPATAIVRLRSRRFARGDVERDGMDADRGD